MKGMEDTLRQRLVDELYLHTDGGPGELADAALAALGLDDLDAAVERACIEWYALVQDEDPIVDEDRVIVRSILEAALLATQEGEDG